MAIQEHVEDTLLSPKQATSLAIIINELTMNALKYGRGDIEIRFMVRADVAVLEVLDDGPGFPGYFDRLAAANVGLELVKSISHSDLQAEVRCDNRKQGGARVTITMPLNKASAPAG